MFVLLRRRLLDHFFLVALFLLLLFLLLFFAFRDVMAMIVYFAHTNTCSELIAYDIVCVFVF